MVAMGVAGSTAGAVTAAEDAVAVAAGAVVSTAGVLATMIRRSCRRCWGRSGFDDSLRIWDGGDS